MISSSRCCFLCFLLLMASAESIFPTVCAAQEPGASNRTIQDTAAAGSRTATTEEYNRRLQEVLRLSGGSANGSTDDYRIGAEDLLEISVLEAPELDRTVRVPANGQISLPLVGSSQAAGLTSRELEVVIQELLRRNYIKDPHISVFVKEMQSHPVSVFGAVKKPGVFQIRGAKTLVQMLSMAEGLSDDAGDTVIVMRDGGLATMSAAVAAPELSPATAADPPAKFSQASATQLAPMAVPAGKSVEINLKDLLDSGDPRYNAPVYPGDVVKVSRAGIVYVIGGVTKPGGFLLKTNENISVLQAIALAEGLTHTSAGNRARIIRTEAASGTRKEISVNVNRILAGREPDPLLRPKDIVFVPNSAGKAALYRSTEGLTSVVGSAIVYRW